MTTTALDSREDRARYGRSLSEEDRGGYERPSGGPGWETSPASAMRSADLQRHVLERVIDMRMRAAMIGAMRERERSFVDPNIRYQGMHRAPSEMDYRRQPQGTFPLRDFRMADMGRSYPRSAGMDPRYQGMYRAPWQMDPRRQVQGQFGPRDPRMYDVDRSAMSPERQRYEYYANIIRSRGGRVDPNRASVLGIRVRDGVTRQFEDRMVVLSPGGRVNMFAASTRPSTVSAQFGGEAELVPGNYWVKPHGPHYNRPSYVVTRYGSRDDVVPVYRDSNLDGRYSPAELSRPRRGFAMLFHVPNPSSGDRYPSSVGCINIRNRDWDRFMRCVGGPRASFHFTLINR
jgi:hypothetical protein